MSQPFRPEHSPVVVLGAGLTGLRQIDHAYDTFDHNYFAATDSALKYLGEQRVISSGRYGDWNYSSMEYALLFGRDAVRRARELLQ